MSAVTLTDKKTAPAGVDAGRNEIRRILVYGAGVLGSLYAGRLSQAGFDVTLLARGQRLEDLRRHGLLLLADGAEQPEQIPVQVTDRLDPDDAYDLVLVVVRKNQLESVLPALAASRRTPNVLFLVNNAAGPGRLVEALGAERVLLGFPGAGGQREEGGLVRYRLASGVQPTTIGELDGRATPRLAAVAAALRSAGLPVAVCRRMDAWLKTHVALVSPIANAIYLAGGSNYRLAETRDGLVLLVRAVKEGLQVLRALKVPITPPAYNVLALLPEPLLVAILQRRMGLPGVELVVTRHANAARDEMQTLAEEFRALARLARVKTPAIDTLYCYLDPANPPLPAGQANLKLVWGPSIAAAGALASSAALAGWLLAVNFARVDRSTDRTARATWEAVLAQPIPQDAILITNDRDEVAPQWYLRYVEGRRADLTGLFPLIQPGPAWSDVAAVTEQALRAGRPVYLIKPMPGLEVKFALTPAAGAAVEGIGGLVRVDGPAAQGELAQASAAIYDDQIRLAGYDARPMTISPGQVQAVTLDWAPLAPLAHDYTTFVHLVNAEGRVIGQSDHRPGGVYYPTSLWRPGDRLRDVHQFTVADDLGPGPYALDSPQRVGEIDACG